MPISVMIMHSTAVVKQERKIRAKNVLSKLKKLFPTAGMMLTYSNNWELMVAVQLSAQCTDKKVNEVTQYIFCA